MSTSLETHSLEDDDFYDEDAILGILPEDSPEIDQEDLSEEGIDEDFLSELGKAKQTPFKRPLKYFVFLLKGQAKKDVQIINLPHPRTGTIAKFVRNSDGKLLELQKAGGLNSWFLNDKCLEDGSLFLSSDIDPVFVLLPIIDKVRKAKTGSSGVFIQESLLLEELPSTQARFLRQYLPLLSPICDVKPQGGQFFYRLNEEKVIIWLQYKMEALCSHLESLPDVATLVRAQASNYRSRGNEITVLELIKISLGFLGEYVEKKWIAALESKIGVPNAEALAAVAKKSYASEEEAAPRLKRSNPTGGFDSDFDKEVATPAPKKKANIHAARLAKVDKRGMSPITSFFKKQDK